MALFIVGVIVLLAVIFLLEAVLLVWVEKLFKLENPTYKNAFKIVLIYAISGAVFGVIGVLDLGFIYDVIVIVASFAVFHFLLKKYQSSSWKKSLGIFAVFVLVCTVVSFAVVVSVRQYIFEPFTISGSAMSPTYNNGDYLLINKTNKTFERGDVVVLQYPEDPTKIFIKRIVALPSETIEIKNGQVFVNGEVLAESYYTGETPGESSVILTSDQYYVLGDNREESSDSRNWGPITKESILGSVFYKAFSLNSFEQ